MYLLHIFVMSIPFLFIVNIDQVRAAFKEQDKILYKDLGTLYFYPEQYTRARRTRPVPQLICLKGSHYPQPRMVECKNTGWDGSSNLWRCKADLAPPYALENAEVVCEGYNSPDDAFVTAGSCSLEYSITMKKSGGKSATSDFIEAPGLPAIFILAFMLILIYVLYKTCLSPDDEVQRDRSSTNNDRPDDGHGPQMGWNIPGTNSRHRGSSPGYGFTQRTETCGNEPNTGNGGGGGGFWTGLATGGVLGYLFSGNRNQNTDYGSYRNPSSSFLGRGSTHRRSGGGLFSSGSSESQGQSSNWFSGGTEGDSTSETVTTARYRQR